MERKLATIRTVNEIKPIEGADMIELALVDGWQCVVKKGEFKPGDPGVYFEIDSYLPIEERYEFLRKSSYKKIPDQLQGQRAEGFRLKTVKLRGQISQGLILPLDLFPELKTTSMGSEVTESLHVELYEPPIPANLAGQVRGKLPGFLMKTDEERIQNLPEYFTEYTTMSFECTEKIDGSSMTVYYTGDDLGVCSRNLNLKEDEANTLWKVANQLQLHTLLKELNKNLALQGEIAGEGIQKNPLKIKGQQFFLFNIWNIDKREHLSPDERMDIFHFLEERVPIRHVPVISPGMKVFEKYKTMGELLDYAVGKSLLNKDVHREGIVFKSLESIGREIVSFKAISNKYLLKHDV
ncbi:MAG: RNA ligase (ATP) [bacterium]|nr:RNA ligase (ATP) [bacterium]